MKFWESQSFAIAADAEGFLRKPKRVEESILETLTAQGVPEKNYQAQRRQPMEKLDRQAAFEQQIKSHLEPASSLAFRLTGDWHAAEEIVQETMLKAVRNWDSFRERSQFKTWLYRILINAFRDRLRSQSKVQFAAVDSVETESREQTVSAQAEANELSNIIHQQIANLPPRQREVLVLTTYESLTAAQISELLGITVDNVYSNLSAARKRLKQQLAPYVNLE